MIKKASCFAALLLMAACSSGSVSDDSSKKTSDASTKPSVSGVEAYEQNATTVSGEKNGQNFVNKLKDDELASALRGGGHVLYLRHARTVKDWGDLVSAALDLSACNTQRRLSTQG